MARASTTISCRAFALATLLLAFLTFPAQPARAAGEADQKPRIKLPITEDWTVPLPNEVVVSPLSDGGRVFVAYRSGQVAALDARDGHELWKKDLATHSPLAASADLLFVASDASVDALHVADGSPAWTLTGIKLAAPIVVAGDRLYVVTDTEVLSVRTADKSIAWRRPAGGVKLPPAIDDGRVFVGAEDGRLLAFAVADGADSWGDVFAPGGVTALAASRGIVYVGGGDRNLYALDERKGTLAWPVARVGSEVTGRISVDDERVYFVGFDNLVRAYDRSNGNQRWTLALRERALNGVIEAGGVIFVPVTSASLVMITAQHGKPAGTIPLPGQMAIDAPPGVALDKDGLHVFAATGGLSNDWRMTAMKPAPEIATASFTTLTETPGVLFLSDPELRPIEVVLRDLVIGDPPLRNPRDLEWPVMLVDPPLVPLTELPGLQMRPLSPTLPVHRGRPRQGA